MSLSSYGSLSAATVLAVDVTCNRNIVQSAGQFGNELQCVASHSAAGVVTAVCSKEASNQKCNDTFNGTLSISMMCLA